MKVVHVFALCLLLSSNFNQMVGTYEELQAYLKEYVEELSRSDERRNALYVHSDRGAQHTSVNPVSL